MRIPLLAATAVTVSLLAGCSSSPSTADIEANLKSLLSTLGRDIATYYVDSNETLTLTREGDIITLATESGSPLTSYELTGLGTEFVVGDVEYRVTVDPATEWCIDATHGDAPGFNYSARTGLSDGPC